jgi:hypothetical protein
MKSPELFWNVIMQYHERYFTFELLMTIVGLGLTVLLFIKPANLYQALMKVYLAFSFGWLAMVFFWGIDRSPLSLFLIGPLFLAIAILFLADLYIQKVEFSLPKNSWQRMAAVILFTLILAYPLMSFLLGHRYPRLTTLYLPCPLMAFTLTLLSASIPRVDVKIYILLLAWAMMALPKVFGLFDVREDTILFVVGVYALVNLVKSRLEIGKVSPEIPG